MIDSPAINMARILALGPQPAYDEEGNVVGEVPGFLTKEQVARLLTEPVRTLSALTAAYEGQFEHTAKETALHDPRAMNAWDAAKKAIAALKKAAKTIDDVETGR